MNKDFQFAFFKKYGTFLKFSIVGIISTLLDLTFLYLFHDILNLSLSVATSSSFTIAVLNSFLLNKQRTFKNTSTYYKRQFLKFLFVAIGGLILTLCFMHILVNIFNIYYILSKIITSILVVIWNFLLNQYRTFNSKNRIKTLLKKDFSIIFSIIIPAYNEEKRLPDTLKKIYNFFKDKNQNHEIIVVDDGSYDGTIESVKKLGIPIKILENKKNKGKGYSIRHGIEHAQGKYILFTDADNSTPIEELDNLMDYIGKYNIVIGSRYCEGAKLKKSQGRKRFFIGRIGNFLIRTFLLDNISDTQCGFKLFQYEAAKRIFPLGKINRFGFDMEILLAAKSLGYSIKEVPVERYNSEDSRVRPFRDAFKTFLELLFIKINYRFDGYK